MSKQFVFIDDSGDPGLIKSSTRNFIVAAVLVVTSENYVKLMTALSGFRAGLGWSELDELKFNKTRKSVIKNLLKYIRQFEFESFALVVDKSKMTIPPQLSSGETLYQYAIKELLIRLNLNEPIIFIDGVSDKKHIQHTRAYLRQALRQHGVTKCKITFVDSRKDVLVQLADIVAGSIARSYDQEKTDQNDYVELLRPRLNGIFEIAP